METILRQNLKRKETLNSASLNLSLAPNETYQRKHTCHNYQYQYWLIINDYYYIIIINHL